MIAKYLLRADRQRQIPPSFSWVDHRLIRHHHLSLCGHSAWALYLFLVTVADVQRAARTYLASPTTLVLGPAAAR